MDSNRKEGETESVPVINPSTQIAQLQALASELKTGFTEAMQELSRIQHGEYALEEKVQSCRCAMEEKVAEMKNSLNGFKEELDEAKSMIEEISAKQEEMQQKIEQLQQEKRKESRKLKAKRIQKEEHGSQTVPTPLQGSPFRSLKLPEPVLINEDFVNLLHNATYEKVSDCRPRGQGESNMKGLTSTNLDTDESLRASSSSDVQSSSRVWKQTKDSKEWGDEHTSKDQSDVQKEVGPYGTIENFLQDPSIAAKRQNIALDLLESERKYVISLSLVLKIRGTFHGQEMKRNTKERSFFPNSLRYLVQQHVDLLHALQERVLSWPRQGILGDIFLKLTNDENNFLDYYVAYLRDLPECISLIHVVILKEIEDEMKSDLYIFFFHIVQRIPEYLLHLQNILKYTVQEHPDYYLLLVCVQRLRVFISHYSILFQCNEDLLIQKRKKLKKSSFIKLYKGLASQCTTSGQDVSPSLSATSIRDSGIHSEEAMQLFPSAPSSGTSAMHLMSHMKKSQQQGMEGLQGTPSGEWESDGRRHNRAENVPTPSPFSEQDLKAFAASLQVLPDTEYSAPSPGAKANPERTRRASTSDLLHPNRSFTPDYEDFEYRGESYTPGGPPYQEEPLQNMAAFEPCSPASSESSIDICFLRPVNFTAEPERTEHTLQPLPKSGAPANAANAGSSSYKRELFRSKGKQLSRSLKEFPRSGTDGVSARLYSTRSSSGSRLPAKQERGFQPHGVPAPSRSAPRSYFPPQRGMGDKPSFVEDMRLEDTARFSPRDDNEQTSFSSQIPRHDYKAGFRSSFRKFFKKK